MIPDGSFYASEFNLITAFLIEPIVVVPSFFDASFDFSGDFMYVVLASFDVSLFRFLEAKPPAAESAHTSVEPLINSS